MTTKRLAASLIWILMIRLGCDVDSCIIREDIYFNTERSCTHAMKNMRMIDRSGLVSLIQCVER